jgi:hypothetical protein
VGGRDNLELRDDDVRIIDGEPIDPADILHDYRPPELSSEKTSLDDARQKTSEAVQRAMTTTGRHAIIADPATGKTTAAVDATIDAVLDGKSVKILTATNDLVGEIADRIVSRAADRDDTPYHFARAVERIEARRPSTCSEYDGYVAASNLGHEHGKSFCDGCDRNPSNGGECPALSRFRSQDAGEQTDLGKVTVTTLALDLMTRGEPFDHPESDAEYDVLIVDEDAIGQVVQSVAVTIEDISRWSSHNDIESPDRWADSLIDAIEHDDSTARLPTKLRLSGTDAADAVYGRAMSQTSPAKRDAILADGPSRKAQIALSYWSHNNWEAAEIKDGRLHLPYVQMPDLEQAESVVLMDATADRPSVEMLLGADAHVERTAVERPKSTKVIRVDRNLTHHSVGGVNDARHETLARAWRRDDVDHLHVTSRALSPFVQDAVDSHARTVLADLNDDVIYHLSSDSRGSNDYESCDSVTLTTLRVPHHAIRQRAAVLRHFSGIDHDSAMESARWQIEDAPTLQAAHRIRPLIGNATVVYVSDRDIDEMEPDITMSPAQYDFLTSLVTGHLADFQKDHLARFYLSQGVEASGGVWMANPEFAGLDFCDFEVGEDDCQALPNLLKSILGKSWDCLSVGSTEVHPPTPRAIQGYLATRFKSTSTLGWEENWELVARRMGWHTTRIHTSQGGERVILSIERPSAQEVHDAVVQSPLDVEWYDAGEGRIYLTHPCQIEIDALAELADVDFREMSPSEAVETVAEAVGCSERTIYRHLDKAHVDASWLIDTWMSIHTSNEERVDDAIEAYETYVEQVQRHRDDQIRRLHKSTETDEREWRDPLVSPDTVMY